MQGTALLEIEYPTGTISHCNPFCLIYLTLDPLSKNYFEWRDLNLFDIFLGVFLYFYFYIVYYDSFDFLTI